MKEMVKPIKEYVMIEKKAETGLCSRRSLLAGSAALLTGGLVSGIQNIYAGPAPKTKSAPPLPWKWVKLDPLEAGRRAYRGYLKNKG
jgi:hypothetical protein